MLEQEGDLEITKTGFLGCRLGMKRKKHLSLTPVHLSGCHEVEVVWWHLWLQHRVLQGYADIGMF